MLVVNEPLAEYKSSGWKTHYNMKMLEENIFDIGNGAILFHPSSYLRLNTLASKPKIKLSALRGKITLKNEKEIDDQISNLRTEWDRNI